MHLSNLNKVLGLSLVTLLAPFATGQQNAGMPPFNLPNAGFEMPLNENGSIQGWGIWFQRQKKGGVSLVQGGHTGAYALSIKSDGVGDWAFPNSSYYKVKAGDEYKISAWVKVKAWGDTAVHAIGYKDRKLVSWSIGLTNAPKHSAEWQEVTGFFMVEEPVDTVAFRLVGFGATDIMVDDIRVEPGKVPVIPPNPPVKGFATKPVVETFRRCPVAQPSENGVYISWRLLAEDSKNAAFDVIRIVDGKETKLNSAPVIQTCDWFDENPVPSATYVVRPSGAKTGGDTAIMLTLSPGQGNYPCQIFKLSDPETKAGKVGIADLDGDGIYDYVVEHPGSKVDPYYKYWVKSQKTMKLDAFSSDGTRLWTFDRGWSIEQGVWYSPYVVADLTGDGRAEVALKAAFGDLRDADGRVQQGDEWLLVLDGLTGKEIARAPWPSKEGFADYNLYSRNQIAVARLDGKTPCLIALRGTYSLMKAEAWQLHDGKLEELWKYCSQGRGNKLKGQGAHTTIICDLDGDGKDEIVLGSAVLDDNGDPLWTTGKGHPDGIYYGDIIPARPGMEMAYVMESRQTKSGGLHVLDPTNGNIIWELQKPTKHVHGSGICSDIDPMHPGVELGGADTDAKKKAADRWFFTADGTLLLEGERMPYGFGALTCYWDADLQREICRSKIQDHEGGYAGGGFNGSVLMVADVLGDWREEVLTTLNGEFRIYSTSIPAMDRRTCLMQDYNYRMRIMTNSQGYTSDALLTSLPSAHSPNLNLTYLQADQAIRVVVTAPVERGFQGEVTMQPVPGATLSQQSYHVELEPNGVHQCIIKVNIAEDGFRGLAKASLAIQGGPVLKGQVPVVLPAKKLKNALYAEAENVFEEKGGKVHVRSDKKDTQGNAISHWDNIGHSLTWKINVPAAGSYYFVARYCTNNGSYRKLEIDGKDYGSFFLQGTGGLGDQSFDWDHFYLVSNGKKLVLDLKAGEHVISMTNTDGTPTNLDYVAFVIAK